MSATPPNPETFFVAPDDGARLAVVRYPGSPQPGVLAVHATGFCKELWEAVARPVLGSWEVLAVDQRGHGDSSPIEAPFDWWLLGRDVISVLGDVDQRRPIGIGHSSGAAALIMAELLRPGTFQALIVIEPIIFPGPFFRADDNPLSEQALRRRASFDSAEAAFGSYVGRGPFARWEERVLRSYVAHAFAGDGAGGWMLKCPPEQEAEFYRGATDHGAWERLGEVKCPVLVVGGSDSESHSRQFITLQADQFAQAEIEIVPGASHFVPMEQPEATARLVKRFLRRMG